MESCPGLERYTSLRLFDQKEVTVSHLVMRNEGHSIGWHNIVAICYFPGLRVEQPLLGSSSAPCTLAEVPLWPCSARSAAGGWSLSCRGSPHGTLIILQPYLSTVKHGTGFQQRTFQDGKTWYRRPSQAFACVTLADVPLAGSRSHGQGGGLGCGALGSSV